MTNTKTLQLQANALAATLDGTPGALLALVHGGYRKWTKTRRPNFQPERRDELLQEILRFCADTHLLECPPDDGCRPQAIADMLDARYPRYAQRVVVPQAVSSGVRGSPASSCLGANAASQRR